MQQFIRVHEYFVAKYHQMIYNHVKLLKKDKHMSISYNKLWKLLIDKDMKRKDLQEAAGSSSASIAKLGRGDNITTDVLLKICETLNCKLEDIMETID